jgi:N-methylhydantoinase A
MEEQFSLSCCYQGQAHSIEVPIGDFSLGPRALEGEFTRQYRRRYSTTLSDFPIIVTAVRTTVRGVRPTRSLARPTPVPAPPYARRAVRQAGDWQQTDVIKRQALAPGIAVVGPLIVEQADTTIWIEPGFRARTLESGSLLIEALR